MSSPVRCSICAKRKPERFCPAKGEKICAPCCGTEREVTLDCPSDCAYLIAAHRYEIEHQKPLTEDQVPFSQVQLSPNLIYERQGVVVGLGRALLDFAAQHSALTDSDALAALSALAETYRTLSSGILYEKTPDSPSAAGLYTALQEFLQNVTQQDSQQRGLSAIKDQEIFYVLVFLARLANGHTNRRPRARIFLEFMRAQIPQDEAPSAEASRIILP